MDFARPEDQNLVCSSIGDCEPDSLTAQVFNWQKQSNETKIATVPLNWMNDYINWIHDKSNGCCKLYNNGDSCISDPDFYSDPTLKPKEEDFRWDLANNQYDNNNNKNNMAKTILQ